MLHLPGKGAPGGHLGPQNALNSIGFNRGLRNLAARSILSIKILLFQGRYHIFIPVPETLVSPTFLIGILDIVGLKMH